MKKIYKDFISIFVTLSALMGCTKLGENSNSDNNQDVIEENSNISIKSLKNVKNIKYDEAQSKFLWDEVINADSYTIKINENEYKTIYNEYSFIPTTEVTKVQVKATDSTGTYASSNWSEVYTYTIPKEEITIATINAFANDMLPYSDLQKIVSINTKDNVLYTEAVFSDGSATYFYKLEHKYEHKLESLEDAMDELMPNTYIDDYIKISKYDSVRYLLQSNEFVGQLEEYRQRGYDISVISSQTVKNERSKNGGEFYIYATYKLDNGSDIKYVKSNICCNIRNASTNEQINYTVRLRDPNQRDLEEYNFEIISPEAVKFAELMDQEINKI